MGKKSGRNPCDRGKSGVKRSTLTEAAGIVVGLAVEGANRHDMKMVRQTLENVPASLSAKRDELLFGEADYDMECAWNDAQKTLFCPEWEPDLEAPLPEIGLCLDKGYDYQEVREVSAEFGYTTHIRCRGKEKQAKKEGEKARRWVVERTHSWLNRFRRLLVRWEKKGANYLALLHFACAILTWNKSLFG